MLDLEIGTRIAAENPAILDIFPADTDFAAYEASILAASQATKTAPRYSMFTSSPIEGIQTGVGKINCAGRAAYSQAMLTEVIRLYPVIVFADIPGYEHYFNAVLDTDTGARVIIDNNAEEIDGQALGTFEILLDPWATRACDPDIYGPIFEAVLAGINSVYENPELLRYESTLKLIEIPFEDDSREKTTKKMHIPLNEMPTDEEIRDRGISMRPDTTVYVFNNDESNRLADRIAYGEQ